MYSICIDGRYDSLRKYCFKFSEFCAYSIIRIYRTDKIWKGKTLERQFFHLSTMKKECLKTFYLKHSAFMLSKISNVSSSLILYGTLYI
jgi:hypothetical protein